MNDYELLPRFLDFSAEVTAFSTLDLYGTGQAESYLAAVAAVVGEQALSELLDAYDHVPQADPQARAALLWQEVFSSEKLGPIARNVIKLWYAGTWYKLPAEWTETYGAREGDVTFVVSPAAYTEGLLWRAIGANPPGAKAPGYGSWAAPPRIEDIGAPLTAAGLGQGGTP
jgi:hypothetical protein